jgi:hypothetical protein
MQVICKPQALAALPQRKVTPVPIEQEAQVGPRAGLDVLGKRKIFAPARILS